MHPSPNTNPISSEEKRIHRYLFLFAAFQGLLWVILPWLLLSNPYIDIAESVEWGRYWQLGYDKNPYFIAWISEIIFQIGRGTLVPFYIASQLSALACLFMVWRLGCYLLTPTRALLACALLFSIVYYHLFATEFNDDTLSLPLWAGTALFFYKAIQWQHLRDWLFVGLFAGLALMTKYYAVTLLLSMSLLLLITPEGRACFKHKGFYVACGLFSLLVVPNIYWLFHDNFTAIHYALNRGDVNTSTFSNLLSHVKNPVNFFFNELAILLPALVLFLLFCKRGRLHRNQDITTFNHYFLITLCFLPFVMSLLFSIITGATISRFWAMPLFSLLGIYLFYTYKTIITPKRTRYFFLSLVVFMIAAGLYYTLNVTLTRYLSTKGGYEFFPGYPVAQELTHNWHIQFNTPLAYVVGSRTITANIAYFSPDRPQAFFEGEQRLSPWIDETQLRQYGAIITWEAQDYTQASQLPPELAAIYPNAELQPAKSYPWQMCCQWLQSRFAADVTMPPVWIGTAFVPPETS